MNEIEKEFIIGFLDQLSGILSNNCCNDYLILNNTDENRFTVRKFEQWVRKDDNEYVVRIPENRNTPIIVCDWLFVLYLKHVLEDE